MLSPFVYVFNVFQVNIKYTKTTSIDVLLVNRMSSSQQTSQQTFTCWKLTKETLEKIVEYVHN